MEFNKPLPIRIKAAGPPVKSAPGADEVGAGRSQEVGASRSSKVNTTRSHKGDAACTVCKTKKPDYEVFYPAICEEQLFCSSCFITVALNNLWDTTEAKERELILKDLANKTEAKKIENLAGRLKGKKIKFVLKKLSDKSDAEKHELLLKDLFDKSQAQQLAIIQYLADMTEAKKIELQMPTSFRVYCSKQGCGAFILPPHQFVFATCNACHSKTCTMCKKPAHGGANCWGTPNPVNEIAILGHRQFLHSCPLCGKHLERQEGCNDIKLLHMYTKVCDHCGQMNYMCAFCTWTKPNITAKEDEQLEIDSDCGVEVMDSEAVETGDDRDDKMEDPDYEDGEEMNEDTDEDVAEVEKMEEFEWVDLMDDMSSKEFHLYAMNAEASMEVDE